MSQPMDMLLRRPHGRRNVSKSGTAGIEKKSAAGAIIEAPKAMSKIEAPKAPRVWGLGYPSSQPTMRSRGVS